MKRIFLFVFFLLVLGCAQKSDETKDNRRVAQKTGYVDIGKTSLYYEEMGQGNPLIMLHGGLLDRRMWDDQFGEFAEQYRAIRYDARGHGNSESVADTFAHHEDLRLLMEGLNVEKAVLMGLSMGGYITIDFALAYPEKVTALILAAPGLTGYAFNSDVLKKNNEQLRQAARNEDLDMVVEYFQRSWTDGPTRSPDEINPAVREKVRSMSVENVKKWNSQSVEKRLDPPAIGRLSEIRIPVLIILGDLDMPDITDIVGIIEKDIKGAHKVVLQNVAHMVNMEKPEEYNRAVLYFLSRL
jgi:pimeloyl-ACP methyl ester carboxylesterase